MESLHWGISPASWRQLYTGMIRVVALQFINQQQQHVRDDHLVDLNNHAFLHVAENWIILGTTPRTNLPTFSSPYTSSLLTTIGGLVDTSYPIYLLPSLGDANKMCQE